MAGKTNRRIDLDWLREAGRAKVRYGRANLTVDRMVSVHLTPLQGTLAAHRRGEVSDGDVAWAFIKAQVIAHTPSFSWDTADLDKLLPRITAVTREPKIKAKTPAQLVSELEAVEIEERERWAKIRKRMQNQIPTISNDLMKSLAANQVPLISTDVLKSITGVNQQIVKSLTPNYAEPLKALQLNVTAFETLRTDWAKISRIVLPQIRPTAFGLDPAIYESLAKLSATPAIQEIQVQTFNFDGWLQQMLKVAEAAKEADSPDIAKAVEATADEATMKSANLDLTPLFERLDELSNEVKRLSASNSIARGVLIAVAAGLILYFIQFILAVKYGIQLPPPDQPPH